ncbi:MAG: hypothetical protein QW291_09380 [Thermofilaceae archaeon]
MIPEPVDYYGFTKLKREGADDEGAGEFCIARVGVIYGAQLASGRMNFAL